MRCDRVVHALQVTLKCSTWAFVDLQGCVNACARRQTAVIKDMVCHTGVLKRRVAVEEDSGGEDCLARLPWKAKNRRWKNY